MTDSDFWNNPFGVFNRTSPDPTDLDLGDMAANIMKAVDELQQIEARKTPGELRDEHFAEAFLHGAFRASRFVRDHPTCVYVWLTGPCGSDGGEFEILAHPNQIEQLRELREAFLEERKR